MGFYKNLEIESRSPKGCFSSQDYNEANRLRDTPEMVSKNYDASSVLTRGKYKGKTFQEASKNDHYIQYCRENAKHSELKALVEFASNVVA